MNTDLERRTWLAMMVKTLLGGTRVGVLLERLQRADLLKDQRGHPLWDPMNVVETFVAGSSKISKSDKRWRRSFQDEFLKYLFSHQQQLHIGDVFVWLQWLFQSSLLIDAVGLVVSGKWIPINVDPRQAKRFELQCRRCRGAVLRRQRDFAEADRELRRALKEWSVFDPHERQEVSVVEYEIGYMAYLHGRIKEAARMLFTSAKHAAEAYDRAGYILSNSCAYFVLLQGCYIEPAEAKAHFVEMYQEASELPKGGRADACLSNLAQYLLEVASANGDGAEAQVIAERIYGSDYLEKLKGNVVHEYTVRRALARTAIAQEDWKAALYHFSFLVRADLQEWGPGDTELVRTTMKMDEAAICYRDAGIALRELGKSRLAHQVWKRGLALPSNYGNAIFQKDIRHFQEGRSVIRGRKNPSKKE